MKYLFAISLLILFSCGGKHEEESDDVEWKEMDDFHMIMADVYHPLKDSNNLAPIKKQSGELATSASTWATAKLPSKVDNDETKNALAELEDGCKELDKMVKESAPDEDIAKQLTEVHESFHSIMESFYKHH